MAYKETQLSSGIVLVEGSTENPPSTEVGFKAFEITRDTTKVDLIAMGVFTEESYEEAVRETSLKMIEAGARRRDNGHWELEDGDSVFLFYPWDWKYHYAGYGKKALAALKISKIT